MTSTYDITLPRDSREGFATRIVRAIADWRERRAQPLTREELELRIAMEREARQAIIERGDAHHGMYQLGR